MFELSRSWFRNGYTGVYISNSSDAILSDSQMDNMSVAVDMNGGTTHSAFVNTYCRDCGESVLMNDVHDSFIMMINSNGGGCAAWLVDSTGNLITDCDFANASVCALGVTGASDGNNIIASSMRGSQLGLHVSMAGGTLMLDNSSIGYARDGTLDVNITNDIDFSTGTGHVEMRGGRMDVTTSDPCALGFQSGASLIFYDHSVLSETTAYIWGDLNIPSGEFRPFTPDDTTYDSEGTPALPFRGASTVTNLLTSDTAARSESWYCMYDPSIVGWKIGTTTQGDKLGFAYDGQTYTSPGGEASFVISEVNPEEGDIIIFATRGSAYDYGNIKKIRFCERLGSVNGGRPTLTVEAGGELDICAWDNTSATTVERAAFAGLTYYDIVVNGYFDGEYAVFKHLSNAGLVLSETSQVWSLHYSEFDEGQGDRYLQLEILGPIFIEGIKFSNTSAMTVNIAREATTAGHVYIDDYTGSFAGSIYELDPDDEINWGVRSGLNIPENFQYTLANQDTIEWAWDDTSSSETGFMLLDENLASKGTYAADIENASETGFGENQLVTRSVAAMWNTDRTPPSNEVSVYTALYPPSIGEFQYDNRAYNTLGMSATPPPNSTAGLTGVMFWPVSGITEGPASGWTQGYSFIASGLEPNATYQYQIMYRNGGGLPTAVGPVLDCTTTAAPITLVAFFEITNSSLYLVWHPAGNPNYTSFEISGNSSGVWTSLDNVVGDGGYPITGLAADTTYFYRVRSYSLDGTPTTWSPEVYARTAAVGNGPDNLSVLSKAPGTITWQWNDIAGESEYQLLDGLNGSIVVAGIGADETSTTESGFTSNEIVLRMVRAVVGGQTTSSSQAAIAYALLDNISDSDFLFVAVGSSMAYMNVTAPPNSDMDDTGAYFQHIAGYGGASSGWLENEFAYWRSGLRPNTTYIYRVRLRNGSGDVGNWTNASGVITWAAQPVNINVTDVGPDRCSIDWYSNENPDWTTYDIQVSLDNTAFVSSANTSNLSQDITGLWPDSDNYFRIAAVDMLGRYSQFVYGEVTTGEIDSPGGFSVNSATIDSITWQWNDVESETGYLLYDEENDSIVAELGAGVIGTTETGLTENQEVYRFLTAIYDREVTMTSAVSAYWVGYVDNNAGTFTKYDGPAKADVSLGGTPIRAWIVFDLTPLQGKAFHRVLNPRLDWFTTLADAGMEVSIYSLAVDPVTENDNQLIFTDVGDGIIYNSAITDLQAAGAHTTYLGNGASEQIVAAVYGSGYFVIGITATTAGTASFAGWNDANAPTLTFTARLEDCETDDVDAFTSVQPPSALTFLGAGADWLTMGVSAPPNPFTGLTGSEYQYTGGGAGGESSGPLPGFYQYTDDGLTPNTTYSYRARLANGDGSPTSWSGVQSAVTYAALPESIYIGNTAVTSLTLYWSSEGNPDWTTYEIEYHGEAEPWTNLANVSGTLSYAHGGLLPGKEYTYRVRAMNIDGIYTEYTSEASETLPAAAGPATFQAISKTTNSITWEWSDIAVEDSYEIVDDFGNMIIGPIAQDWTNQIEVLGGENEYAIRAVRGFVGGVPTGLSPMAYEFTRINMPGSGDYWTTSVEPTRIMFAANEPPNQDMGLTGCWFQPGINPGGGDNSGWLLGVYEYTDEGLIPNSTYTYKFKYRNGSGDQTMYNIVALQVITPCAVPGNPLVDNISYTYMDFSWTKEGNPDWTTYEIYYSFPDDSSYMPYMTVGGGTTKISATSLMPGTKYYFKVWAQAVDGSYSNYSLQTYGETLSIPVPDNFRGTVLNDSSITWEWDDVTVETGYEVYDDIWIFQQLLPADCTSWIEGSLAENSLYARMVRTVIGVDNGNFSPLDYVYSGVHDPLVTDFWQTFVGTDQIRLVAIQPPNGLTGLTGVEFELVSGGEGGTSRWFAQDYTYTNEDLQPNNTYTYRIRYRNVDGVPTAYSTSQSFITDAGTPWDFEISILNASSVHLSWETDANPPWTKYVVERSIDDIIYVNIGNATALSYDDSGLNVNTTYYYHVYAVSLAENYSNYTMESIRINMQAPQNFRITGCSSTTLTWEWDDVNSFPNEDGFDIFDNSIGAVQIADIAQDAVMTVETGLLPNTTYYRHIESFGNPGTKSYSGPSNAVSACTMAAVPVMFNASASFLFENEDTITARAFASSNPAGTTIALEYAEGDSNGPTEAFSSLGVRTSIYEWNVGGLNFNTSYWFRARAQNWVGIWTDYCNVAVWSTTPGPPSNFRNTDCSSSTLTWEWDPNGGHGFIVFDNVSGIPVIPGISGAAVSTVETGLSPNTTYRRHIIAYRSWHKFQNCASVQTGYTDGVVKWWPNMEVRVRDIWGGCARFNLGGFPANFSVTGVNLYMFCIDPAFAPSVIDITEVISDPDLITAGQLFSEIQVGFVFADNTNSHNNVPPNAKVYPLNSASHGWVETSAGIGWGVLGFLEEFGIGDTTRFQGWMPGPPMQPVLEVEFDEFDYTEPSNAVEVCTMAAVPAMTNSSLLTFKAQTDVSINATVAWVGNPAGTPIELFYAAGNAVQPTEAFTSAGIMTSGGYKFQVTGLAPETTYWFQARAQNWVGIWTGNCAITRWSTEQIPVPTVFTGTGNASDKIKWTWTDNANTEDSYEIMVDGGAVIGTVGTNTVEYVEGPLAENTQYTRLARAVIASGPHYSGNSNTDSTYTLLDPPLNGEVTFGTVTTSSIVVNVDHPPNCGSDFTGAEFEETSGNLGGSNRSMLQGSYSYTDDALFPNTTYAYRVRYQNGDGVVTAFNTASQQKVTLAVVPDMSNSIITFTTQTVNSITANVSTDSNPDGTIKQLFYAKGDETGPTVAFSSAGTKTTGYSFTLLTLEPDTSYWFYARAQNHEGIWTDNCAITVWSTDPVPAPTGLSGIGYNATTIEWTWTDNAGSEGGQQILENNGALKVDLIAIDATFTIEGGLSENTQYSRVVRAYAGLGPSYSDNSNVASAYTLCLPPNTPEISFENVSAYEMKVRVGLCPGFGQGLTAAQFFETRGPTSGSTNSGWVTDIESTRFVYWDRSLFPNTTYSWKARYRNGDGITTVFNTTTQNQATLAAVPILYNSMMTFTFSNSDTIRVMVDSAGNPVDTEIELLRADGTVTGPTGSFSSLGIQTSAYIWENGSLTPSTWYWFKARARNWAGIWSGNSALTAWSTNGNVPMEATNPWPPDGATVNNTQLRLRWDDAPSATGYIVFFCSSSPAVETGMALSNFWVTGTLQDKTTYYWAIKPFNDSGNATETPTEWSFYINVPAKLDYARNSGSTLADLGEKIAALPDGSYYVVGTFSDTAIFGPGDDRETSLTTYGQGDIFIAKFNPDGTLEWARKAGSTFTDEGYGVAALPDGTAVITGYFAGTATFGEGDPAEANISAVDEFAPDVFIAKYNPDGTLAWVKSAGDSNNDVGFDIAIMSDGSSVVTGFYEGTPTFGQGDPTVTVLPILGMFDIFVAMYDNDGVLRWASYAGGTSVDQGFGVAAVPDGTVRVTGSFSSAAVFGEFEPNETNLTSQAGSDDIFVASYNSDGSLAWVRQAGGTNPDYGMGISTIADGTSFVTGYYWNEAVFGEGDDNETKLSTFGTARFFIARYNADGTIEWVCGAEGLGNTYGYGISAYPDGTTAVCGAFQDEVVFGAGDDNEAFLTLLTGTNEIFVAKYNPDGTLCWLKGTGDTGVDAGRGVAAMPDNSAVVTGQFNNNPVFGIGEADETQLNSAGMGDIYIARFRGYLNYPTGLLMADCSSSTLSWEWNDTNPYGGTQGEDGFDIFDAVDDSLEVNIPAADSTNYMESLLDPNTTYSRYVRAYSGVGPDYSSRSRIVDGCTLAVVPLMFNDSGTFLDSDLDNITVYVDPDTNAVNTSIELEYAWGDDAGPIEAYVSAGTQTSGYTWVLTGLMPHTSYWFRAKAINHPGISTAWCDVTTHSTHGGGWAQRFPGGSPTARYGHAMAFDSTRNEVVLYGGFDGLGYRGGTTWLYNGSAWNTSTNIPQPNPRSGQCMAYDSVRGVTVMFGGYNGTHYLQDTWEFNSSNLLWQMVDPGPTVSVRQYAGMAFMENISETFIFGGYAGGGPFGTCYLWDGSAWGVGPVPVFAAHSHSMTWDPDNERVLIFGGYSGGAPQEYFYEYTSGSGWADISTGGEPSPRYGHVMAYNSHNGELLVFGGNTGGGPTTSASVFFGGNWFPALFTQLPSARDYSSMVYDSYRRVMVLFGGRDNGGGPLGDTWIQ
ncbi:MAG: fibronectin type III domain-containing protein [Planctomycetota bacterium]